jgi:endoglucanase
MKNPNRLKVVSDKFFNFNYKFVVSVATLIIIAIIIGLIYQFNQQGRKVETLEQLWTIYKDNYIDTNGRAIDEQSNGITTSEGQSYSMLRGVWQNDRETFDKSWKWAKDNLRRSTDNLFAWKWGKNPDGNYGVLIEEGGQNIAVDADIDIAWSLILASKLWNEPKYLEESVPIIKDIWRLSVINSGSGKLILASNNLEKEFNKTEIIVNPSYFTTYAMRDFAKITPDLEWNRLASDCYYLLNKMLDTKFDGNRSTVLPLDWLKVNSNTLEVTKIPDKQLKYSYDAVRVPWRAAYDWKLNQNQEALEYLKRLNFLSTEWQNKNTIYTSYGASGNILGNYESLLGYSTSIAYFDVVNPNAASTIYSQKIIPRLNENMSYYDSNWVAFGLALYYKTI